MSNPQQWITDKYIYLMLIAFPLFTGFDGYLKITQSKYFFLLILTGIWIAATVFFELRNRDTRFRLYPAHISVLIFLAVSCLSALFSEYGTAVILGTGRYDGLITIFIYVLIFFGVSMYGQMRTEYVYAVALSATITCIIAVIQLFGKNPFGLFPGDWCYYDAHTKYTSEFLGTIGNTNLLSGFLCLALPASAVTFIISKDYKSTVLFIPLALGIFIISASHVDGGLVGMLGCAAIAAPLIISSKQRLIRTIFTLAVVSVSFAFSFAFTPIYRNGLTMVKLVWGKTPLLFLIFAAISAIAGMLLIMNSSKISVSSRKIQLSVLCLIIIAAILVLLFVYFYPHDNRGTIYEFSRILHGDFQDSFGSSRIMIWKKSLQLVPDHLLFGSGPDTLAARIDMSFSRHVAETGKTLATYVDNAHNEYIGYLVNIGLLGLLAYVSAILFTAISFIKNKDSANIRAASGCALICYWIQGIFGLGLCIVAPIMWLFWGLTGKNLTITENYNGEEEKEV